MKRVQMNWSPEHSYIYLNRTRDINLAAGALVTAAAAGHSQAEELRARRFPSLSENSIVPSYGDFGFDRDETGVIVDALACFAREEGQPLRSRRARSLIGDLVVVAEIEPMHP